MSAAQRLWRWLKEHVVFFGAEKSPQKDNKGGGIGLRWKF